MGGEPFTFRSSQEGKEQINFGRFNDSYYGDNKGSLFLPVQNAPISNIFDFRWCPEQKTFQVMVFKKRGPYIFRKQTADVEQLLLERSSQPKCDLPPSPPSPAPPLPPLAPPPEDTCTDEAKDFKCKKSKCKKKYSDEEKKQCEKTCGLCEAPPSSAPPPSAPEDKCGDLEDQTNCKIKNCEDSAGTLKTCEKQCKKSKLKKKCQKTCCDLS